jgi:hypothetical protein
MRTTIMSRGGGTKIVDLNRRKAVHQKCLNCCCWEVHRVNACEHNACKLHPFRTGTGKQDAKARSQAIRDDCRDCTNGRIELCSVILCPTYIYRKSVVDNSLIPGSFLQNDDIENDFDDETEAGDVVPTPSVEAGRSRRYMANSTSG